LFNLTYLVGVKGVLNWQNSKNTFWPRWNLEILVGEPEKILGARREPTTTLPTYGKVGGECPAGGGGENSDIIHCKNMPNAVEP